MRDKGARSPGKHTIKVVSRCDLERPKERFQFCGTVSRIYHTVKEKKQKKNDCGERFKIGRGLKEGTFCYYQAGQSHLFPQLGQH